MGKKEQGWLGGIYDVRMTITIEDAVRKGRLLGLGMFREWRRGTRRVWMGGGVMIREQKEWGNEKCEENDNEEW